MPGATHLVRSVCRKKGDGKEGIQYMSEEELVGRVVSDRACGEGEAKTETSPSYEEV
uniref:Uncharacterized protein n=1 Tax=Arion vulgaris TaxID=1028688 RepID=A0A0B6ZYW1_9EUPU